MVKKFGFKYASGHEEWQRVSLAMIGSSWRYVLLTDPDVKQAYVKGVNEVLEWAYLPVQSFEQLIA